MAPMIRSCIAGPVHLCSAVFIVRHAARSCCSSSRCTRRSRLFSSRLLMLMPKRWNGDVDSSGGSWKRPQLTAARRTPSARLTVASVRPFRYCALNRAMSAGFSSAVTGNSPSASLSCLMCPRTVPALLSPSAST